MQYAVSDRNIRLVNIESNFSNGIRSRDIKGCANLIRLAAKKPAIPAVDLAPRLNGHQQRKL